GGQLTPEQKGLRGFYADLLRLVNQSHAIRHGAFYDLQYANQQTPGYNAAKMYAYLRHSDRQKLLIVCNFDLTNGADAQLQIPPHAWETMGLSADGKYTLKEIFHHPQQLTLSAKEGVPLQMQANSVRIFEILK
ncbi:MAG: alpha amylase C-terminal domain-containing protein, partial [Runella sp.]